MTGLPIMWRLRTLAFAALALAVFGALNAPPWFHLLLPSKITKNKRVCSVFRFAHSLIVKPETSPQ